jgi:microcin C transport system substrate-binding protein
MRLKKVISLLLILIFHNNCIYANESISIGYSAKYNNFDSFDYVNKKSKKGGNITISAFGTFDSLNPFLLKSLSPAQINNLMFDTLMTRSLDEPSSSYALVAKSYQLSDDKLSVTYILDETATFSNSMPITADDVKYSFDLLTSKAAHPQYRIYWADIKEARVINKKTITFIFKRKNPELHMMVGDLPILSREWVSIDEFPNTIKITPIASGPYTIKTYSIGKNIVYVRNKNYWAINKPSRKYMFNFDTITIKYYKDMTVALEAFKAGEYDYILENHSKRWARDYNGPNFLNKKIIKTELVHLNNTGIQGFAFNTRNDIFSDINLRKAITTVFDFEWSNKNLFYNQYLRSNSYFSNSELSAEVNISEAEIKLAKKLNIDSHKIKDKIILPINNNATDYRKSLIQAKKILDNAGYYVKDNQLYAPSKKPIVINFLLAQKGFERILAPFRNNLKRLGINLNYRTVDLSLYQQRLDNYEFDMTVVSYPQSQSPGSELVSMFSSVSYDKNGAFNFPGIRDKDVDKLIEEIIYSSNRQALITSTHLLDRILWNQYYLVPNWFINTHRIAYYDKFIQSSTLPLYYQATNYILQTWSVK